MEMSQGKLSQDILISGETLSDLVHYLPHAVHSKNIKSGKYILSNQENVKIYGIVGATVHGLAITMRSRWDHMWLIR